MAKNLIQIAIIGAQIIGRAFTRALRQELQFIQKNNNTFLDTKTATETNKTSAKTVQADRITGMSLQEAKQILNINDTDLDDPEKVQKNYEHLFNLNDKTKGGSFYLQSKIYRAKERLDKELKTSSSSTKTDSTENPNDTKPS
ncbi:unnamed protein product [Adineta steineri]|uniref:Mitochondrial import inner membrane translocase subunit tim16 n=1 Tax=Adineta steineri TaxID=433720 RepID=A0A814LIW3_9BILA|nr:unnamed protein product [Adineta steineri]CAF3520122.1 unnamed protein product [Adineta steineri]CAF3652783.1 unnamed protein product [Adineta steineri]